jgi:integrase
VELRHERCTGLVLRVTSGGRATWSFAYRSPVTGEHARKTLGPWPALKLKAAEAAGYKLKAMVGHERRDPVREEKAARTAAAARQTFGQVAELYMELVAKRTVESWRNVDAALRNHLLPAWRGRAIGEIRRGEVNALLDGLTAAGKLGAAREVRKHASRIFGWAFDREIIAANPAAKLQRHELRNRRAVRRLEDDELRALWLAADPDPNQLGYPWAQTWRLLLLTGARRNEIARMRWSEIDREARALRLPAARHKSRRGLVIPFSAAAWAAIATCERFAVADAYVLSCTHGRGPVIGFSKAKKKLDAAAERILGRPLPPYRTHDLRVAYRTRLARVGVPREVAEACLGHAQPALERAYDAHDYLAEMRDAMERYAAHVLEIVEKPPAKREAV